MKISGRNKALLAASAAAIVVYSLRQRKPKSAQRGGPPQSGSSRKKHALDKDFFRKLKVLVRIIIPGIKSKEAFLLALHTCFLISRTFLSIYVATLDGQIVKSIVNKDKLGFAKELTKWIAIGIPATYVNAMIRFLESKLTIAFRSRLTQYATDKYMENDVYYRVSNLDDKISNVDQSLTSDISNFAESCSHLYSALSKPCLDVVLMSGQLYLLSRSRNTQGSSAISGLLGTTVILISNRLLRAFAPPFGKYVQDIANREGEYRACHARLITHSEEVAFYGGQKAEKTLLERAYLALVKEQNVLFRTRIGYNMLEGFLMKYIWAAAGMCMISIPQFAQGSSEGEKAGKSGIELANLAAEERSTRTQDYIVARKLLIDTADAIERVMSSYKEVMELAGFVARVYDMLETFEDLAKGKFSRMTVGGVRKPMGAVSQGRTIVNDEVGVRLTDVPIMTPNGDLLIDSISFEVKPGMHLLITGPNGCGKSSLFRIIGGLWPVHGGSVERPSSMFYIPQKAYLVSGTLRDQVIYPDSVVEMRAKLMDDSHLEEIFDHVHLHHILQREGGWDASKEWSDVLSGGEKQRLAMARLFYHKPKYAILDECTSAVSIDVEGKMYSYASEIGISLITVTHRPSLWKYHNFLLQFDGEGGWKFAPMNAEERMGLKEEKSKIEGQLSGVGKLRRRLDEICLLLGETSVLISEEAPAAVTEGLHSSEEED